MTVQYKTYSHCPKKLAARQATIIDLYRKFFGKAIPSNKQYWSMCAQCALDSKIIDGSELGQIKDHGLIKISQFHGVDRNLEVYNNNKTLVGPSWYKDDFLVSMQKAHAKGNFNPAIVNADLINMPDRASSYIANILDFLYGAGQTDTMLVVNVVFKSYTRKSSIKRLVDLLSENTTFRIVWSKKLWTVLGDQVYWYKGTDTEKGASNTVMGSIVFIPSKRINDAV